MNHQRNLHIVKRIALVAHDNKKRTYWNGQNITVKSFQSIC